MAFKKQIMFDISAPGEPAAGIPELYDRIIVTIESGNPGGEKGEFAHHMRQALEEWYDGAKVEILCEVRP